MPTTDQDLRALTYLAQRLREETYGACKWDEVGVHAVVAKLAGRNLAMTIEQVTRHAADPEAKTPGAINRPFLPEPKSPETYRPPRKGEICARHEGHYADNCAGCRADQLAGDAAPGPAEPRKPDRSTELEAVRKIHRDAAAGLCSHKVPPELCADHDPRRQPRRTETQEATA